MKKKLLYRYDNSKNVRDIQEKQLTCKTYISLKVHKLKAKSHIY